MVLLQVLKIKDNADHAGLSPPLVLLKDSTPFKLDTYQNSQNKL